MIPLSCAQLVRITQGDLVASSKLDDLIIDDLVTDSRLFQQTEKNENINPETTAFLALKGANFDAQRFVTQVAENGCALVIVEQVDEAVCVDKTAQLVVEDTRVALGQIAAYVKQQVAPKTVGITGSSGKTTVKEMVAEILSQLGNVLATKGNFNNDIGVPLTLLRLEHHHDFAVIEMGANHLGEIAYTTNLVKPDVALINNIAAAHLEGFGDLSGVARAKGEIFSSLSDTGVALYNQDTPYTEKWQWRLVNKNVKTFSSQSKANSYSTDIKLDEQGCAAFMLHTSQGDIQINLTIPGQHNVANAVAAASIAIEFGASLIDIQSGLAKMQPVKGRLNLYQLTDQIKLIDDSYNANLESVKAGVKLLCSYQGKTMLVLGDMGELGSEARSYHQEVGEYAAEQQLDALFTLGVLSQSASDAFRVKNQRPTNESQHFNHRDELLNQLFPLITELINNQQALTVLVKGSRSAHMEQVAQAIIAWFEHNNYKQNEEGIS